MPDETGAIQTFIARWQASSSAERANYAMFLTELCSLLGVPGPDPTRSDDRDNAYVFERAVPMDDGDGKITVGRIDLYKRGCFVLEAKQGSGGTPDDSNLFHLDPAHPSRLRRGTAVRGTAHWDVEMKKAKGQAERYVRYLPSQTEGNPPFILVVDVGHVIEVYADFSRLGKTYSQFPDAQNYRIALEDLNREEVRKRLAMIWTDPLNLDPTRHSAKVTRQIAEKLARLAKSFEAGGRDPQIVAAFLMRCLFTFFAEDVGLIDRQRTGEQPFTELLKTLRGHTDQFVPMAEDVWQRMDAGGFSPAMRRKLKHFNGKLFKECQALAVTPEQLEYLIEAGESDWSDVEPAIFGTLLERALEPRERHKLGAHYTPRAYVERLVLPTVIEPLREKWDAARAAAFTLNMQGKNEEARKAVHDFLAELCQTIVLDPACGSGNFLYVTMEHMKKLEGEARDELRQLGETQELLERGGLTVDPHQFLGLEINPRAVAIAELVLWIGYLKWHLKTLGHAPSEPLLKDFQNIKEQDAVLAYDRKEIVTDEAGKPVSRWDGHTMKVSPITDEEIPDETARVPIYRYVNPKKAEWPRADYVVGNPPFIGNFKMRVALGEGYAAALRGAYPALPESIDLVMYWWHKAAEICRSGALQRFGLIATNSLRQKLNRRVLFDQLGSEPPVSLVFAIPDHPWVDTADGAAVRISMTCAQAGKHIGQLRRVVSERDTGDDAALVELDQQAGMLFSDLTVGADVAGTHALDANAGLACPGVKLHSAGFIVSKQEAESLGLGRIPGLEKHLRQYRNGRDIAQVPRNVLAIDLFGLSLSDVQSCFPETYQWIFERVKPERDARIGVTPDADKYAEQWWLFGKVRRELRSALRSLRRYIATVETSKHRVFVFLDSEILPDNMLVCIASDDAFGLGVLSSRIHVCWALAAGGRLGVGNDPRYSKTRCFDPFPFPAATDAQKSGIRSLGESLDAHRKRQQALHPGLTITDMYNVLEKLRKNEELTAKDRIIHEQGLVSVLKQIHDDLDAAVADAYGWPVDLSDEEILRRLVALNAERAEEEKRGIIRWLRPEFQNPTGQQASQGTLGIAPTAGEKKKKAEKLPWPKTLAEQAQAVRLALASRPKPATAAELCRQFKSAKAERIAELLDTLTALGQARAVEGERFVA